MPRLADTIGVQTALNALNVSSVVTTSQFTSASLPALKGQIEAIAQAPSAKSYGFGLFYDPATDELNVQSTAPQAFTVNLLGGSPEGLRYAVVPAASRATRTSDGAPHHGGSGITDGSRICSSGFAVSKSSRRFMVTAGHCFSNGTGLFDESFDHTYGTVSGKSGYPGFDIELISGSTYSRDIYAGGATGRTIPVVSAGDPSLTGSYCHSGRTTFEHCGDSPVSLEASFCDADGCTDGLVAYTGVRIQEGDSGSPFYANVNGDAKIRGENIAYTSSYSYAEQWSFIADHLGVSVVTTAL